MVAFENMVAEEQSRGEHVAEVLDLHCTSGADMSIVVAGMMEVLQGKARNLVADPEVIHSLR